jgi:hypothetical protein
MDQIRQDLVDHGELIGFGRLAGPQSAKIIISDGVDAPVVTDGPFAEMKEFLAGYWMIDVDSEERAIEIAARTSAAPGPGGRPTQRPIEVRTVMDTPDPEL